MLSLSFNLSPNCSANIIGLNLSSFLALMPMHLALNGMTVADIVFYMIMHSISYPSLLAFCFLFKNSYFFSWPGLAFSLEKTLRSMTKLFIQTG